jgi:hypothetical protein
MDMPVFGGLSDDRGTAPSASPAFKARQRALSQAAEQLERRARKSSAVTQGRPDGGPKRRQAQQPPGMVSGAATKTP